MLGFVNEKKLRTHCSEKRQSVIVIDYTSVHSFRIYEITMHEGRSIMQLKMLRLGNYLGVRASIKRHGNAAILSVISAV